MEEGVVDRQHGAAWIAEQVGDPLVHQGAHHHLGAGHDFDGLVDGGDGMGGHGRAWLLGETKKAPEGPGARPIEG